MKKYFCFLLFLFSLMFFNCVGLMESAGRFIDGSYFAEKTLERFSASIKNKDAADMEISVVENKLKEHYIIISLKKYPMMKLRASYPDEKGAFHLLSLEYLSGSAHGWNEYSMQLLGMGHLILSDTAELDVIKDIEAIQISQGRIQRYDTRITGNEALLALRNRSDRIAALGEWMHSLDQPKGQDIKSFQKLWKPIFFPEMVSNRNKPENWLQAGDVFHSAEEINWNTGYTERVFSQDLWQVRNSGTLLRDWEEALYWIYLEYEWNSIKDLFSHKIILKKIK